MKRLVFCLLAAAVLVGCGAGPPELSPELHALLKRSEFVNMHHAPALKKRFALYIPLADLRTITEKQAGELLTYAALRQGIDPGSSWLRVDLRCRKTREWYFGQVVLERDKPPEIETHFLKMNRDNALGEIGLPRCARPPAEPQGRP